jgi:hypothetical protein
MTRPLIAAPAVSDTSRSVFFKREYAHMFSFFIPDGIKNAVATIVGILFMAFMLCWGFGTAFHAWNKDRLQTFACDAEKLTAVEMEALFREHWSEVHFTNLVAIDEDAAAVIAASKNWFVRFAAVTELTPAAELIFAGCEKRLEFPALREIKTSALAEHLATRDNDLQLDGLTQLTPEIAAALAKHRGNLSLNGIHDLSLEAAKALCQHCSLKTRRTFRWAGRIRIPIDQQVPVTVSLLGLDSPKPEVWGHLWAFPHVIVKEGHQKELKWSAPKLPFANPPPAIASPVMP